MLDFKLNVGEIMVEDVFTLPMEANIAGAVKAMLVEHVRCIPVVDKDGKLQGVLTDSDIAFRTTEKEGILEQPVSEIMSKNPLSVAPDTDIFQVVKLMEERHIRRLPVVANDKVVGIVSVRDVVRQVLRNLESFGGEEEEE